MTERQILLKFSSALLPFWIFYRGLLFPLVFLPKTHSMNMEHWAETNSSSLGTLKPHVHFVALIAYNKEAVAAATDIAIREVQNLYSDNVTFTYSAYWNALNVCDDFDSSTTAYLADFYYVTRLLLTEKTHPVILATGCSSSEYAAAELAREWNIPIIVSVGTGSQLKNKKHYPTLIRFTPSDTSTYPLVFKTLLDNYKWKTISFICDVSTEFGEYTRDFYRGTCSEFAAILQARSNYKIFSRGANLSNAEERIAALLDAKLYSRVIVVISHMDYVKRVILAALSLNMTTPEYVFITHHPYYFDVPGIGDPSVFRSLVSSEPEVAKAFECLLIVTLARLSRTTKTQALFETIQTVARNTYNLSSSLTESQYLYGASTYNALHVTAQTINEAVQLRRNLSEGSKLVKLMHNRTFDTPCSSCEMNKNGDLENVYAIVGMSQQTGNFEELFLFSAKDYKLKTSLNNYKWIRSEHVALDRPVCGYRGDEETCARGESQAQSTLLMASCMLFGISGIFAAMSAFWLHEHHRHCKMRIHYLESSKLILKKHRHQPLLDIM